MAATAGKKALVQVATAAQTGPYTTVANIKNAQFEMSGVILDASQLGTDWMAKLQGLKDAKLTLTGNYDNADTNGQLALRAAFLNDTPIYVQHLVNGVNGAQFPAKVTKFGFDSDVTKEATVTIDIEQTGGVTIV